jgi:alpha-1,2-mannosyltransferase
VGERVVLGAVVHNGRVPATSPALGAVRPRTSVAARRRDPWITWRIPLLVGVVALAIRLSVVLRGGGLYGYYGYDDGVYFSAAASFVFGRLPYRDFLLLHPPGIMLVLAPFAELGRLTSDRDAMAVARAAFLLLGAINVALTARLAGVLGRTAALVAGGLAAVWVHAVYVDRVPLLEPVGNLFLLIALLLLTQRGRVRAGRAELLAGLALGLSIGIKVWGVVPFAILGVFVLVTRGWRAGVRMGVGAAVAGLVVCGPFFLAAPREMFRMLVLDQIGRPEIGPSAIERPPLMLGVTAYVGKQDVPLVVAISLGLGVLLLALGALALREPRARVWMALLVGNVLLILAAPVYFAHYSAFLAVPLALVIGAGAAEVARSLRGRPVLLRRGLAAVTATALAVLGLLTASLSWGRPYPGDRLAAFLPESGCVRADDPGALIQLNVLSRNLERGCTVHVDFTGITYDLLARTRADGTPVSRRRNADWQRYARAYLMSGSSTVLVRGAANGFSQATQRQLRQLPVLGRVDGWRVLGPPTTR